MHINVPPIHKQGSLTPQYNHTIFHHMSVTHHQQPKRGRAPPIPTFRKTTRTPQTLDISVGGIPSSQLDGVDEDTIQSQWVPKRPVSAKLCTAAQRLYSPRNVRPDTSSSGGHQPPRNNPRCRPLGISSSSNTPEVVHHAHNRLSGVDPLTNGRLSHLAIYKEGHVSVSSSRGDVRIRNLVNVARQRSVSKAANAVGGDNSAINASIPPTSCSSVPDSTTGIVASAATSSPISVPPTSSNPSEQQQHGRSYAIVVGGEVLAEEVVVLEKEHTMPAPLPPQYARPSVSAIPTPCTNMGGLLASIEGVVLPVTTSSSSPSFPTAKTTPSAARLHFFSIGEDSWDSVSVNHIGSNIGTIASARSSPTRSGSPNYSTHYSPSSVSSPAIEVLETATSHASSFDVRIARAGWRDTIRLSSIDERHLRTVNQRYRLALTGGTTSSSSATTASSRMRPQSAASRTSARRSTQDPRIVAYQEGIRDLFPDVYQYQTLRSRMVFSTPTGSTSPRSKYAVSETSNPLNAARFTRNTAMKRSLLSEATNYVTGRSINLPTHNRNGPPSSLHQAEMLDCGLVALLRSPKTAWSVCVNPYTMGRQILDNDNNNNKSQQHQQTPYSVDDEIVDVGTDEDVIKGGEDKDGDVVVVPASPSPNNNNQHIPRADLAAEVSSYTIFIQYAILFNEALDTYARRGRVLLSSLPRTWEVSEEDGGSGAYAARRMIPHSDAVGILDVKEVTTTTDGGDDGVGSKILYSVRVDSPPLKLFEQDNTNNNIHSDIDRSEPTTTIAALRKLCNPHTSYTAPSQVERGKAEYVAAVQRLELMDAFSHFTLERSGRSIVVEVLSYAQSASSFFATPLVVAVHTNSSQVVRGGCDVGSSGQEECHQRPFRSFNGGRQRIIQMVREHVCNDICKSLKLSPMMIH